VRSNKIAGGSPAAGNFLLPGHKKVTKEKAAPANRRWRGVPALLGMDGGCGTRVRHQRMTDAQTVLAESPVHACAARRFAGERQYKGLSRLKPQAKPDRAQRSFPLANRPAAAGRRGAFGEDCLSFRHAFMAEASSAAAAPDEQRRDTTTVAVRWGGFSLVTFSCPHKRK